MCVNGVKRRWHVPVNLVMERKYLELRPYSRLPPVGPKSFQLSRVYTFLGSDDPLSPQLGKQDGGVSLLHKSKGRGELRSHDVSPLRRCRVFRPQQAPLGAYSPSCCRRRIDNPKTILVCSFVRRRAIILLRPFPPCPGHLPLSPTPTNAGLPNGFCICFVSLVCS